MSSCKESGARTNAGKPAGRKIHSHFISEFSLMPEIVFLHVVAPKPDPTVSHDEGHMKRQNRGEIVFVN